MYNVIFIAVGTFFSISVEPFCFFAWYQENKDFTLFIQLSVYFVTSPLRHLINDYRKFEIHLPGVVVDVAVLVVEILVALVVVVWVVEAVSMIEIRWQLILIFL